MKKYMFLAIFAILPMQGYCDRFLVSYYVNDDIGKIEQDGGIIKDVRQNDCGSYTIVYRSGADIRAEADAWKIIGK